jgi:hypothetical protein
MLMYYILRFLDERRKIIENAELEEKKILQEMVNTDIV